MRKGRRCCSKYLKENEIIELKAIRETNNKATTTTTTKREKKGILEIDLNSEVTAGGLNKKDTGKTKQLDHQLSI